MFVEEFDEANGGEHFGYSENEELRGDPKDGQCFIGIHGGIPPLVFHQGGGDHRKRGEKQADADALEGGDPGVVAGEPTGKRNEEGVVEGDYEDEYDIRDGLEGCRGDVEGICEACVHCAALLDRECLKLSQKCVENDGAGEYGND